MIEKKNGRFCKLVNDTDDGRATTTDTKYRAKGNKYNATARTVKSGNCDDTRMYIGKYSGSLLITPLPLMQIVSNFKNRQFMENMENRNGILYHVEIILTWTLYLEKL